MKTPVFDRWVKSDFREEWGEFDRAFKTLLCITLQNHPALLKNLLLRYESIDMIPLTQETWNELENTDSRSVQEGDWEQVKDIARHAGRDWERIFRGFEQAYPMKCPIILHYRDRYHLVAGNTRLCVSRALGIIPNVVIIEW